MSRLLFCLSTIPFMIISNLGLADIFNNAIILKAYSNGTQLQMSRENIQEFSFLFNEALENSHEMPAYCVSLHQESLEALESGFWVRFIFQRTQIHNDLPFNELLFKIEKDSSGVNIIRNNFGLLEGRCFHLSLQNNFNKLYDFLEKVDTQSKMQKDIKIAE